MAEQFLGMAAGEGDLYDQFHAGVAGARPVYDAASTFNQISEAHQQDQDELRNALSDIKVSYTGSAADNMQDAFQPLLNAIGAGSQKATDAAQSLQNQGDHFAVAQANIQKSAPVPAEPWYENFDPANTDYDNALQQNSNIDSANQAVYKAYGNNTASNDAPQFKSVVGAGLFGESDGLGPLAATSGTQLAPSAPDVGVRPRSSATTSTTQHVTRTPEQIAAPPNPNAATPTGHTGPQGSDAAPIGSTSPIGSSTATQGYSGSPTVSPPGTSGVGSTGAPAAVGQGGSATPTGTDPMVGGRPIGPVGLRGLGSGAQSAAGAEAQQATADEAAESGAARTNATAPGALGGRSGRREEDREHKTAPYLVNEDNGNEIIGDLDRTAPPVIGL